MPFDLSTFQAAVGKVVQAANWAYQFTDGDENLTFNTDSGPKKSFAKAIKDFEDEVAAIVVGIDEAPSDATPYARQDATWVPVAPGGIDEAPGETTSKFGRANSVWQPIVVYPIAPPINGFVTISGTLSLDGGPLPVPFDLPKTGSNEFGGIFGNTAWSLTPYDIGSYVLGCDSNSSTWDGGLGSMIANTGLAGGTAVATITEGTQGNIAIFEGTVYINRGTDELPDWASVDVGIVQLAGGNSPTLRTLTLTGDINADGSPLSPLVFVEVSPNYFENDGSIYNTLTGSSSGWVFKLDDIGSWIAPAADNVADAVFTGNMDSISYGDATVSVTTIGTVGWFAKNEAGETWQNTGTLASPVWRRTDLYNVDNTWSGNQSIDGTLNARGAVNFGNDGDAVVVTFSEGNTFAYSGFSATAHRTALSVPSTSFVADGSNITLGHIGRARINNALSANAAAIVATTLSTSSTLTASASLVVTGQASLNGGYSVGQLTVGTLPSATAVRRRYEITDALAPSVGAIVAAGGSALCEVRSNGTNWIVTQLL